MNVLLWAKKSAFVAVSSAILAVGMMISAIWSALCIAIFPTNVSGAIALVSNFAIASAVVGALFYNYHETWQK